MSSPSVNPLLRPSGFAVPVACSGALKLVEAMQACNMTEPPTVYAEEGTTAHALAAEFLTKGIRRDPAYEGKYLRYDRRDDGDAIVIVNDTATGFAYEGMIAAVEQYVAMVQSNYAALLESDPDVQMHIEHKVSIPMFNDREGTVDCALISRKYGRALLFDYKHGRGVPTSALVQGKCYAIGIARKYPFVRTVGWAVVQPNVAHYGLAWRGIMQWGLSELDMTRNAWESLIAKPEPLLTVGPHCAQHFCPARSVCPAIREETEMKLKTAHLTEDQLRDNAVWLVRNTATISSAVNSAQQRLLMDLESDKELPETIKLVQSASRGSWKTPHAGLDVTRAILGEDGIQTARKPAAISSLRTAINRMDDDGEKAAAQKLLDENYVRGEGKKSLVPAEDGRRPVAHSKKFSGGPGTIDLDKV